MRTLRVHQGDPKFCRAAGGPELSEGPSAAGPLVIKVPKCQNTKFPDQNIYVKITLGLLNLCYSRAEQGPEHCEGPCLAGPLDVKN